MTSPHPPDVPLQAPDDPAHALEQAVDRLARSRARWAAALSSASPGSTPLNRRDTPPVPAWTGLLPTALARWLLPGWAQAAWWLADRTGLPRRAQGWAAAAWHRHPAAMLGVSVAAGALLTAAWARRAGRRRVR